MSQTIESPRTTAGEAGMPSRRRSRGLILIVMIVAFIGAYFLLVERRRGELA